MLEDDSCVLKQILLRRFGNRSNLPSAAKTECSCVFNIVGGKSFTQHWLKEQKSRKVQVKCAACFCFVFFIGENLFNADFVSEKCIWGLGLHQTCYYSWDAPFWRYCALVLLYFKNTCCAMNFSTVSTHVILSRPKYAWNWTLVDPVRLSDLSEMQHKHSEEVEKSPVRPTPEGTHKGRWAGRGGLMITWGRTGFLRYLITSTGKRNSKNAREMSEVSRDEGYLSL